MSSTFRYKSLFEHALILAPAVDYLTEKIKRYEQRVEASLSASELS